MSETKDQLYFQIIQLKDRIINLEAELKTQRLNNIAMQESVASAMALLVETEARLDKAILLLQRSSGFIQIGAGVESDLYREVMDFVEPKKEGE